MEWFKDFVDIIVTLLGGSVLFHMFFTFLASLVDDFKDVQKVEVVNDEWKRT